MGEINYNLIDYVQQSNANLQIDLENSSSAQAAAETGFRVRFFSFFFVKSQVAYITSLIWVNVSSFNLHDVKIIRLEVMG